MEHKHKGNKMKCLLECDNVFFKTIREITENHKLIYNELLQMCKDQGHMRFPTLQSAYDKGLEVARNNNLAIVPEGLFMELHYLLKNVSKGNFLPRQFSGKGYLTVRSGKFFRKKSDGTYSFGELRGSFTPSADPSEFEEAVNETGRGNRYAYINIGVSVSHELVEVNFSPPSK